MTPRTSLNMVPSLTVDDRLDIGFAHPVQGRQATHCHAPCGVTCPNLQHILFGQFRQSLATTPCRPPAFFHPVHIPRMGIGFQVRRPHTSKFTIVTKVSDERCFGGRFVSGRQDVGDDVRTSLFSVHHDVPVPVVVAASSPDPTRSEFWTVNRNGAVLVDLVPEATLYRSRLVLTRAGGRTEAGIGLTRPYAENIAAHRTGKIYTHQAYSLVSRPGLFPQRRGTSRLPILPHSAQGA